MLSQSNLSEEIGVEAAASKTSIAAPEVRFGIQRVLAQTRSWKSLLTLRPFDVATEQGRSRERYRRAALTTITSGVARAVTVITWLVTVRLTVHYLGTERYGLWMTITSLVAMMSFADLGIGNGLLNSITEAKGGDDRESVRKYVSTAFFLLLTIATVLIGLFVLVYALIPWPRVFNVVSAVAAREAGPAVFVFRGLLRAEHAVGHRSARANRLSGRIRNESMARRRKLNRVVRAARGDAFSPWTSVAAFEHFGRTALGRLRQLEPRIPVGASLAAARFKMLGYRRRPQDPEHGRDVLDPDGERHFHRSGRQYHYQPDFGARAVTQYAVPMRLFLIVVSLSLLFVFPLWPAYGEAMARRDVQWVRATLINSLRYSLVVFGPLALVLALSGKLIVHIWVGPQIQPSYAMLLGMGTWSVMAIVGNALATFFNGTNHLKVPVFTAILMALTNLILKLVFTRYLGLWAIPWATVLSSIPSMVIQVAYASKLLSTPGVFSQLPSSRVAQS